MAGATLTQQRIVAYTQQLQESESFWNAILVFLGALALLTAIPFYPIAVAFVLALICGAIAMKKPPLGVGATWILAIPAFAFQSTVWGWLGLLLLAIVFFEMFDNWGIIALLEVICLLPFAAAPFAMLGGMVYLLMLLGSFHFGSRKSVLISVPAVFIILLLSSLWLVPNNAFLPVTLSAYEPAVGQLALRAGPVELGALGSEIGAALGSILNFASATHVWAVLGKIFSNSVTLLFMDGGIVQLMVWGAALYVVGMLPRVFRKGRWNQTKSALAILLVPLAYFLLSFVGFAFSWMMFPYFLLAVAVVGAADFLGAHVSRERKISAKEKMKSFGKFGLQDMSIGGGEEGLDDVGGYDDVKDELRSSIVLPLQNVELASAYGIKPPSGILLFGPPGTGKTMLMRALSKELDFRMYYVKSSDILSKWVGESEKNISEIFAKARESAPAILFFDEIDALGKKRMAASSDDVGPRVLSILLLEMDGLKTDNKKPVIVVGATNVPNKLDPALMRPGRFDKIVYMHLPDKEAREAIFKVHMEGLAKKGILGKKVDYRKLAAESDRYSGADIANVVKEAVGLAAGQAKKTGKVVPVTMDLLRAVLEHTKPSTTFAQIEDYDEFRTDFERSVAGVAEREAEKAPKEKEAEKKIGWNDVADLEDVKRSFREAIETPLLHPELVKRYGVKPTKGILMFGPPGCGKTLVVRAASNELDITFLSLGGAQLMKRGYTHAVNVIKETFNRARENPPSVIFIDEIETVAPSRDIGRAEITGQFLVEMDGIKGMEGVMIVGATNKPEMLDPAILRPGRFDKIIYVHAPDSTGREQLFNIHLGEFATGLDLKKLAKVSEGFSGADIAAVAQQARMYLLRESSTGKEPKLTTEKVVDIISRMRPSITAGLLAEYERFITEYGERL